MPNVSVMAIIGVLASLGSFNEGEGFLGQSFLSLVPLGMAIVSVLLTRPEAAAFLKVTTATLASWACSGRYSLPMVKVGRNARYRLSDLEAFVESRTVTSTVEADALREPAGKKPADARARRILG